MKTAIAAGTKIGLKRTKSGVATIKASTVPVRVRADKSKSVRPIVTAVMNLTAWREAGWLVEIRLEMSS